MKCKQSNFALQRASRVILLLAMLFFSLVGFAQTDVTGKVVNAKGEPIIGATVSVVGTVKSVSTSDEGQFRIEAATNDVLEFTSVGYATQRVPVTQAAIVIMNQSTTDLDEVVVVGYGTQLKKDLTGATSVVNMNDVNKIKSTTIAGALQGLATGVTVRSAARPGMEEDIQIRGIKNLSGYGVLYVVDGLPTYANRDFNPDDIESIQILKDASAAAIYGSRAANGVIIITTKKGKEGPLQVEASASYTVQQLPRYKLAGKDEFVRLNNMAYANAGLPRQDLRMDINTNWQDVVFRTGNIQDYNVSVSGGGKNSSFFMSGGYFGHKGAVIGTDFKRYNFRVNTQGSRGIFSFGQNLAVSNAKAYEMQGNPFLDVVRLFPTIPVLDENNPGGYGYGDENRARTFGTNPYAIANLIDETNENFRLRGAIWGEIRLAKFLKYKLNVGYETSADHHYWFRKPGFWTLNQPNEVVPILNENRARFYKKLIENYVTFKQKFGKHDVGFVAGQSYEYGNYQQIWGTKREQPVTSTGSYFTVLDLGTTPELGGFGNASALMSYFGRLEYNYDNKYLLNGILRRDGTSVLAREHQWGNFPSVSAAWRISNEKFFNVPQISDLKLRANYGTLGSSNIAAYSAQAFIGVLPTIVMGTGQNKQPTGTQNSMVNTDLRWETLTMQNYGFDLALFNNKLTFSAEYYIANTNDVLTRPAISLTTGHSGAAPLVNAVSMQNKGLEFTLGYKEMDKIVNYYANVNFTTNSVFIKDLAYGRSAIYGFNQIFENGARVGQWYVLKTMGIFQTQQEVDDYKNSQGVIIQPDARPGDFRFYDKDDNGQINQDDRMVVGNSWAKFELGLNTGLSYKNLSLTMNWFGSFGQLVYNGPRSVTDRFDDNSNYRAGIQPWTPENPNNHTPRAIYQGSLNAQGFIDRWLEDGSFFRLKLIDLSYDMGHISSLRKVGFTNAKINVSGQNLLTFTKYTGLDPEFQNLSIFSRGHDYGAFPNAKSVSLGIQLGF